LRGNHHDMRLDALALIFSVTRAAGELESVPAF
ncbi:MAG: hypothetical protein ACI856_002957, partial [Kiritimatiellia bacterium]